MTELIREKQLSPDERTRLKYVTKTIDTLTEDMRHDMDTGREYFIIMNENHEEVFGKIQYIATSQSWRAEWYNLPNGQFTITPIMGKTQIICFSLTPVV